MENQNPQIRRLGQNSKGKNPPLDLHCSQTFFPRQKSISNENKYNLGNIDKVCEVQAKESKISLIRNNMHQGSILNNYVTHNNQSKSPRKNNDKAIVKSHIKPSEIVSER